MPATETFVIVGASLAGAKAAETLRAEGFDGRVVLIGAEADRPYERPPLSKDYLRGESTRDDAYVHSESFYNENEIELWTSTSVSEIDTGADEVVYPGGRLHYDRLLLSTGAFPRRLPIAGSDLKGVYYLRELSDSDAIAARLNHGGSCVVIGAGWIGAEVAASARQKGLDVTIIEQTAVPLERVLGPQIGAIYRDIHLDHGVQLLTETKVDALEGEDSVERVRTADGRVIDCDFVVVGVGVAPRTELAEKAGLALDNGVICDDKLKTDNDAIFAAGDVANCLHPLFGRLRVEHWANALNQGPAAAKNMLGRNEAYDRVPYFFSDQYDVGMEYSGDARNADELVVRGDPASREFIAFWLAQSRLVAAMNVNVWDVTDPIQSLIKSQKAVDSQSLADTQVALEDMAASVQTNPLEAAKRLISEGASYTKHFISDRLTKHGSQSVTDIQPGTGEVISLGGEQVAVYKDPQGTTHAVSAVCTHMGCIVGFNSQDQTWDCPCHGSRFDSQGQVISGPAKTPLPSRQELL